MKKILLLTESELDNVIRRVLIEKMGVPDNISETAEEIYNQILASFNNINPQSLN